MASPFPPSTYGDRPMYLEPLVFQQPPPAELPSSKGTRSPSHSISSLTSTSSSSSSFSTLSSTLTRPRLGRSSPSFEEDIFDKISIRSIKHHLRPKMSLRRLFHRQTEDVLETIDWHAATPHISAVPKVSSILPSPPRSRRPTTSALTLCSRAAELECTPCYYFVARNCNGYVLGGGHGDACENCAVAGFFGSP